MKILNVNCPSCKSEFNYYVSTSRPFCSSRCRDVDLGHWLSESYTVASQEPLCETDLEVILKLQEDADYEQ